MEEELAFRCVFEIASNLFYNSNLLESVGPTFFIHEDESHHLRVGPL